VPRCACLALGGHCHEALQDRRQRSRIQQYRVCCCAWDASPNLFPRYIPPVT
jgi:hypothetical protein